MVVLVSTKGEKAPKMKNPLFSSLEPPPQLSLFQKGERLKGGAVLLHLWPLVEYGNCEDATKRDRH